MLKHVAIIPDGNRRYSKKTKTPIQKVYEKSIEKIFDILRWCQEKGIKSLTIWGFSTENWKRPETEKRILFGLFERKAKEVLSNDKFMSSNIKVRIIGDLSKFSRNMRNIFKKIEDETKDNGGVRLNLLLNYGGRSEIISAINTLLKERRRQITESEFKKYLWVKEEPDLIIRTSGEQRLSGLLPFQSVYAELFFIKKYFPEMTKRDFYKIIREYNQRERRFGR